MLSIHAFTFSFTLTDHKNSFFEVSFEGTSVICTFLSPQSSSLKNCTIIYGPLKNCELAFQASQSTSNTVVIGLSSRHLNELNNKAACFRVTASNHTFTATVVGTATLGKLHSCLTCSLMFYENLMYADYSTPSSGPVIGVSVTLSLLILINTGITTVLVIVIILLVKSKKKVEKELEDLKKMDTFGVYEELDSAPAVRGCETVFNVAYPRVASQTSLHKYQ